LLHFGLEGFAPENASIGVMREVPEMFPLACQVVLRSDSGCTPGDEAENPRVAGGVDALHSAAPVDSEGTKGDLQPLPSQSKELSGNLLVQTCAAPTRLGQWARPE
jgi:hypothetical protein